MSYTVKLAGQEIHVGPRDRSSHGEWKGPCLKKKVNQLQCFAEKGKLRKVNILLILPFQMILCFQVGADNPKGCSTSSDGLKKEF